MSLHIEPTEDAVETLRKERRKNYIAALATSILSVVLAGAILYSLTIIIAPPEEPKVVGYITPDEKKAAKFPQTIEIQQSTQMSGPNGYLLTMVQKVMSDRKERSDA